jgi:hypothetical protein
MKRSSTTRGLLALVLTITALGALAAGTSSAAPAGPVTKTFSFIAKPNSNAKQLFNIDQFQANARCDKSGLPVIFGFTSADNADLFGRVFDGLGRLHIIKNTTFTKRNKGVLLSTTSGDFDSTGTLLFETSTGTVVTVQYAFDNSMTLGRQNLCTVFGSYIAS